jgi:hypothetical protein
VNKPILLCVSTDTTVCINWYYSIVCINWCYCVYQLILLCVATGTIVCINWYYFVYQLILLRVSADTIGCINWYYFVYQLITPCYQITCFSFFLVKTSHTLTLLSYIIFWIRILPNKNFKWRIMRKTLITLPTRLVGFFSIFLYQCRLPFTTLPLCLLKGIRKLA